MLFVSTELQFFSSSDCTLLCSVDCDTFNRIINQIIFISILKYNVAIKTWYMQSHLFIGIISCGKL